MIAAMKYKSPLELSSPNSNNINASVIWLHGLGADGYDFEPIVEKLAIANVRFILPHAPEMSITRNSGYMMPAWYDLYGAPNNKIGYSLEDEVGIIASQQYINALIEKEINRGIPSERIIIAGFSQGGAIALYTAIRYPKKLGGILALSTYLPMKEKLNAEAHAANAGIPIFMAHGVFDEVISLDMCKISLTALQTHHFSVSWHEYNMAHSVCIEEIDDIRQFLKQVL